MRPHVSRRLAQGFKVAFQSFIPAKSLAASHFKNLSSGKIPKPPTFFAQGRQAQAVRKNDSGVDQERCR